MRGSRCFWFSLHVFRSLPPDAASPASEVTALVRRTDSPRGQPPPPPPPPGRLSLQPGSGAEGAAPAPLSAVPRRLVQRAGAVHGPRGAGAEARARGRGRPASVRHTDGFSGGEGPNNRFQPIGKLGPRGEKTPVPGGRPLVMAAL